MPSRTAIAAHRGGADLWPENSFTAFRNAAELPVEFVEFDVHVSADGRLVVHHDPTLDRMTDSAGAIMDMTWPEIAATRINGTDERPPELAEAIEIFKPTSIDLRVEIKLNARTFPYPGVEAEVAAVLRETGMLERTVVSAFSLDTLARFRACAAPGRGYIWLINPMTLRHIGGAEGVVALTQTFGVEEVAPRSPDMTPALVEALKAAGLRVGAFAVNDAETIARMLALDLVAFTSDRPDLALAARDGAG